MQESQLYSSRQPAHTKSPESPSALSRDSKKCQILAKKGFLNARNITSGLVLLIYSKEFQVGVLLRLPPFRNPSSRAAESQEELFAKSAIAMILAEFETLGVEKSKLVTYVIGGSATQGMREVSRVTVKRALWGWGLPLSASDIGGKQVRSIWMDVESGRTIVRSEPISGDALAIESPLQAAC